MSATGSALAPAPGSIPRRWLPTLVVFGAMLVTVLGGYVVAGATSTEPAGPVEVGGVVLVRPAAGWALAGRFASGDVPGARLTRGSGNLDVLAAPFDGDAGDLANLYVEEGLRAQADAGRLSTSPSLESVIVASGLGASRFSYVGVFERGGAPVEGEVTVLVSPGGSGVIFDGWAPEGQLEFALDDIHTMEEEAEVA